MNVRPATILSIVLAAACILSAGCEIVSPLPADDQLISFFAQHRTAFDNLVRMMDEDSKLSRITYRPGSPISYTTNNDERFQLSDARWAEYRKVFDELGVYKVEHGSLYLDQRPAGFIIEVAARGTIFAASFKGYFYLESKDLPTPIVKSIGWWVPSEADVRGKDGQLQYSREYRKIEGNWFLYRLDD